MPNPPRKGEGASQAELVTLRDREVDGMRRAIQLGARALGTTSPNPPVGCVVLDRAQRAAGKGFTAPPGGPHAEVAALRAAGERARGGTAVVTLEPCNHHGRTPPCTKALIEAGIARVVYAVSDPHPLAAGGAGALRAAGVEVEGGLMEPEAARGMEAWLTYLQLRRPFVTWVYGASLDGRIAGRDGSPRWLNSEAAQADLVRLRAQSDAVLTSPEAPSGPASSAVAVSEDADVSAVLGRLYERETCAVLLEGSPRLAGSFLGAGLIDKIVAYIAPMLLGGGGLSALLGEGAGSMDAVRRFRLDEVGELGGDLRLVARALTADR